MIKKWFFIGFILSIIFVCGIIFGVIFHIPILSVLHITTTKRHYCPYPPFANQIKPFIEDQLTWQVASHIWKAPQEVVFMQALIKDDNALVCYYKWPNPQEEGTYLWLTVELSIPAEQIIIPAGSTWKNVHDNDNKVSQCTSGLQSCPFSLLPE